MPFFKNLEKAAKHAGLELENKPEIYKKIGHLQVELTAAKDKATLPLEIRNAAKQLADKLEYAMQVFDKETQGIGRPNISVANVKLLAETCHTDILTHQATLMTAPTLWNQIKAAINDFLEYYLEIEPIFNLDCSELGLKADFNELFNQTKTQCLNAKS